MRRHFGLQPRLWEFLLFVVRQLSLADADTLLSASVLLPTQVRRRLLISGRLID